MAKNMVDKAYEEFNDYVKVFVEEGYESWVKSRKNHHIEVEISIAWDDEDEYEHEGYYHTIDDAIEALISLKNIEKDFWEN